MEEILGLLIALGAIILKVVGNRLEKSGKSAPAAVPEEESEPADFDFKGWVREALYEDEDASLKPEVVFPEHEPVKPAPKVAENVVRQTKPAARKTPILVEEEPKKKGEKIDPKKLVIYSEIMKPKYTE